MTSSDIMISFERQGFEPDTGAKRHQHPAYTNWYKISLRYKDTPFRPRTRLKSL